MEMRKIACFTIAIALSLQSTPLLAARDLCDPKDLGFAGCLAPVTAISIDDPRLSKKRLVTGDRLRKLLIGGKFHAKGCYDRALGLSQVFSTLPDHWTTFRMRGEVADHIRGTWTLDTDSYSVSACIYPNGMVERVYRLDDGTYLMKIEVKGIETYVVRGFFE